jgi:ferredoxin-NAD(P)+ reductase (naphthalene dioxygenase ferredoxin-specific)
MREHGVPISYSCMAGRCGTCRCKVLEGEVADAGADSLKPGGPRDGHVLACQSTLTGPCTIEVPEPDEVVIHPARILKATVSGLDLLAPDVIRLRLTPAKPLEFTPGQYAQLQFAHGLARPYSMAGLSHDKELEFHIRRVEGGRATGHVFDQLRLGDAVRVSGPLGAAYLRKRHAGPILCAASGTGLAPVLAILRGLVHARMANPVHLYLGAHSAAHAYGAEELRQLQTEHPSLTVHKTVVAGEVPAGFRRGVITDALRADWPGSLAPWRAYLCGSPPMVEAVNLLLQQKGLPAERIHADAFYLQDA